MAIRRTHGAPDSGAVYVFKRIGGVWDQTDYLKASNTNAGDEFGVRCRAFGQYVWPLQHGLKRVMRPA